MTEDETVGWHHWLNGHEFEQAPEDCEGKGGLVCCSSWGHKESDTAEWLNNKVPCSHEFCNNVEEPASLSHHMEVYPVNTCKELLNEQEINFIMLTLGCISSLLPQWGNFVKILHNLFSNLLSYQHRGGIPIYLISFLSPNISHAFSLLYTCNFPFLPPSLTPMEILLHSRSISCLFCFVKSSRPFQFPTASSIILYLFFSHLYSCGIFDTHMNI